MSKEKAGSIPDRVLAYGELLWDMLPAGKVLGGAPANFAVRVASFSIPVSLASRVGADPLGVEALNEIARHGVDVSLVQQDPEHPTGTVGVVLNDQGEPDYEIHTGVAYDHIELSEELLDFVKRCRIICFGTLIQRTTPSRESLYALLDTAPASTLRFLDVNLRRDCFSPETIVASLERANYVKLSGHEVAPLAEMTGLNGSSHGAFAESLRDRYGLEACLITLGAEGIVAAGKNENLLRIGSVQVPVADSIGAGDAFTAGFVVALLRGGSLEACCRYGIALGALACTKPGGMAPITPAEVEAILAKIPE